MFSKLIALQVLVGASVALGATEMRVTEAGNKGPIEIPMRFENGMGVVDVMVNGQGPFIFGIDTGAEGAARLDSSLVVKLGLKATGEIATGDPSGRNRRAASTVRLDSVELGGVRFTEVEGVSRDFRNSPRPLNLDGILGLKIFAEYLITLDFPGKKIRLERGELPKADGAEVLEYTVNHGIPTVDLLVGSARIKAQLDSGNGIGEFVLPTALVEKLAFASEPVIAGRAHSPSGDMEIKKVRLKDAINLGANEFTEPTVTYPALSDVGNVGAKILSQFAITFDQQHSRVRLKRPASGLADLAEEPGIAPTP